MPRVSKDGINFFDIDDSPDEMEKAYAKGYKPYMQVTKNGRDVFDIEASADELQKASAKGYVSVNAFSEGHKIKQSELGKIGKIQSGVQGVADSFTFGFDDELAGGAMAAKDALIDGKDFGDAYTERRDAIRSYKDKAREANPGSYLTGQIAGGVVTPTVAARSGANFLSRAGRGAAASGTFGTLQGLGDAEKFDEKGIKDALAQGGISSVLGGTLGGFTRPKAALKEAGDLFDGTPGNFKTVFGSAIDGMKIPENERLPSWLSWMQSLYRGGKEGIEAVLDISQGSKEFASMVQKAKRGAGGGGRGGGPRGPSFLDDLPDEEFALMKLLEPGTNEVKEWIAQKAASLYPGQIDSKTYLEILNKGADERIAARQFNKIDTGEAIKEPFEKAYRATKQAAGEQYGRLTSEARETFEKLDSEPVDQLSDALMSVADRKSISSNVKNVLTDVISDLDGFASKDAADQFDALLKARQSLGDAVKWSSKNELPEGQKLLQNAYVGLNRYIQSLDQKKMADLGYATFKNLEDNLFKKVAKVERGVIKEIDPIKLEKIFSNSDSGRRLYKAVEQARNALDSGKLPADQAQTLRSILDEIDGLRTVSDNQRLLSNFRYRQGPTSPAIERQTSVLNKSRPLAESVQSPSGFLNAIDEFFPAQAKEKFGKSFNDLADDERMKLIRFWTWRKANPKASMADESKAWNNLR